MQDLERIKRRFKSDTENHSMEILQDDGLYRHLKFTNNGSQCYRFDLHTWPGYLCVDGDMGCYVFSRTTDMFDFFIMGDNDFNKRHIINPHYWGEKIQAAEKDRGHDDINGYMKFSSEAFKEAVKLEYDNFCEAYADDDAEDVTEAYPEGTQTRAQQLEDLWENLEEEVIENSYDGQVRAYDAAMAFKWASDDGELSFDMCDFWDHSCTEYTFHYIWILYAIVWGIGEYNKVDATEESTVETNIAG